MKRALVGLVLLTVLFAVPAEGQAQEPRPLIAIDGIGGFSSVSRVEFPAEGTPLHRLEAVYLFPDRARWRILAVGGRSSARQLVYRLGESAYELPPGGTRSQARDDSTLLQLELRRATMLWPHGFDWKDAKTPADTREHIRFARVVVGEAARLIGTLKATLDKDGRPRQVEALNLLGKEIEKLAVDSWQELEGRRWPERLSLYKSDRAVWHETVEEVRTHVYFVDAFFQPPDRRPLPGTEGGGGRNVLALDLQGITYRLRDLDEGVSWETALARAEAWRAEAADEVEHELDPVPTLRLGPDGLPTGVFLRLAQRNDSPPAGWTTIGDRPGLALALGPAENPGATSLRALAAAVPAGARAGTPYCRVVTRAAGRRQIQLYLPLEGPERR